MIQSPPATISPEVTFVQQLVDAADFSEGFSLLTQRLRGIIPFERLSVFVFPRNGFHPQCHVVSGGSTTAAMIREVPNSQELINWLHDHPDPYPIASGDPVFIPSALKQIVPGDHPYHIMTPIIVAKKVVGCWLLAVRSNENWKPQRIASLKAARAAWGLWLDQLTTRDEVRFLHSRLANDLVYLRDEIKAERGLRCLAGESPAMKAVRWAIRQVASTDSTVLIHGETGTGKELVARAIHQASARRERLQVNVNCGALAPSIVASELFGHEPGAFTGAGKRRIGRFELAHQGTLFLDEIAEISPEVQVMLLRVLQEKTIERVGGNAPIPVHVRLIAATHQDLAQAVASGKFRADLYYRLVVFPIRVPPLRERREDIPDLVRHFLHHFNHRMNKQVEHISPSVLDRLVQHDWPGNVRELENLIERAVIVADGDQLDIDPSWLMPICAAKSAVAAPPPPLRDQEKQTIVAAIAHCRGKIYGPHGAAARLGLKPTTLYGKMRKYGIQKAIDGE